MSNAPRERPLVDAILSPPLRGFEEARAALLGELDARVAWERLASRGLIPMDWVDHPTRLFGRGTQVGARKQDPRREPWSVVGAALFAAEPGAIVRAEALCSEAMDRWRALGWPVPDRLSWKLCAAPEVRDDGLVRWPAQNERLRLRSCTLLTPRAMGRSDRSFENGQHYGDRSIRVEAFAEQLGAWRHEWEVAVGVARSPAEPVWEVWTMGLALGHSADEVDLALTVPPPGRFALENTFAPIRGKDRRCEACGRVGAGRWCEADGAFCLGCSTEHGYWNSVDCCYYCDEELQSVSD